MCKFGVLNLSAHLLNSYCLLPMNIPIDMRRKSIRLHRIFKMLALLCAVNFATHFDVKACPPLPVLLYPVDEVYAYNGWEIPELPDDAIAVIGDTYISKSDYKQWLYRKIGFEPDLKKQFLMRRRLTSILQEKDIDLERELQLIMDHFFRFEVRGRLYESTDDWHADIKRMENISEHESYRDAALPRVKEAYLEVLYLANNWDDIHANVLASLRVEDDAITVPGDDPELQHVLGLLNAFFISQRLAAWIQPYIAKMVLANQDLNLPDYTEEYIDWLYENHNTKFLVENYLGMVLSGWYAEENNLEISETVVQEEFTMRVGEYEELVSSFNRSLPVSAIPLEVSPIYVDYIMTEVVDDLHKSRAHRRATPLRPYELTKRYYDTYGYQGVRNEVREIFKWVRRRRASGPVPGYAEYVAAEEARIRAELEAVRESIIADGVANFPRHAITANRKPELQQTAGRVNLEELYGEPDGRWGAVRDYTDVLENLALNELSPVMKGPWNSIDLFWVADAGAGHRSYYMISRDLPPLAAYEYERYQQDLAAARKELKDLTQLITEGAAIENLAAEHSDSYSRYGVDISATYQQIYGYDFAKQIGDIPAGGLGIISSAEGLHLVQVVSRDVTPLTDEIRAKITKQYNEELANQDDRYVLTTLQLFSTNPYFRTTE